MQFLFSWCLPSNGESSGVQEVRGSTLTVLAAGDLRVFIWRPLYAAWTHMIHQPHREGSWSGLLFTGSVACEWVSVSQGN